MFNFGKSPIFFCRSYYLHSVFRICHSFFLVGVDKFWGSPRIFVETNFFFLRFLEGQKTLVLQDVDLGWNGLFPSLAALDSTEWHLPFFHWNPGRFRMQFQQQGDWKMDGYSTSLNQTELPSLARYHFTLHNEQLHILFPFGTPVWYWDWITGLERQVVEIRIPHASGRSKARGR